MYACAAAKCACVISLHGAEIARSYEIPVFYRPFFPPPLLPRACADLYVCRRVWKPDYVQARHHIYKDYTTNPISTSFFTSETILQVMRLLGRAIFEPKKKM